MDAAGVVRLVIAKTEILLDDPRAIAHSRISLFEAHLLMFWVFLLVHLMEKHREQTYYTVVTSPFMPRQVRAVLWNRYLAIERRGSDIRRAIWAVGMGGDRNNLVGAHPHDPQTIAPTIQQILRNLDDLFERLIRFENDVFFTMPIVQDGYYRWCTVLRKAKCEQFWRTLMVACWSSPSLRDLCYFTNLGGWVDALQNRMNVYTAFERGPQLAVPDLPLQGNCFVCLQPLTDMIDYEAHHLPASIRARPFPQGQEWLSVAPAAAIVETSCCNQMVHKTCLLQRLNGNRCPRCQGNIDRAEQTNLVQDAAKEYLNGTLRIKDLITDPRRPAQRWPYR